MSAIGFATLTRFMQSARRSLRISGSVIKNRLRADYFRENVQLFISANRKCLVSGREKRPIKHRFSLLDSRNVLSSEDVNLSIISNNVQTTFQRMLDKNDFLYTKDNWSRNRKLFAILPQARFLLFREICFFFLASLWTFVSVRSPEMQSAEITNTWYSTELVFAYSFVSLQRLESCVQGRIISVAFALWKYWIFYYVRRSLQSLRSRSSVVTPREISKWNSRVTASEKRQDIRRNELTVTSKRLEREEWSRDKTFDRGFRANFNENQTRRTLEQGNGRRQALDDRFCSKPWNPIWVRSP